jgi:acylphosphatase
MESANLARLKAIVEGRVQGVGFRYFVVRKAEALGLKGWFRNRWDDTVEVSAEGERDALERLVKDLRRGPTSAFVTDVKTAWSEASGEYDRFSILPTA